MSKYLEKITLEDAALFGLLSIYFIFPESTVLSLVGHAFTAFFTLCVLLNDSKNFKFPLLCGIYALFVISCFLSIFYSIEPGISTTKTITVAILLLLFVVGTNYFSHPENTIKFEIIFVTVSCMACVYLILQGGFGSEGFGEAISNKNEVGVRLGLGGIVCLYSIFRKFKWWKIPVELLLAVCCAMTGSRSALVVLLVGVVLMIMFGFSSKDQPVGLATILVLSVIGITVYMVFNVPAFYDVLGYRFEQFFDLFTEGSGDSSANKRLELIQKGIEVFEESPIYGQGLNTFAMVSKNIVGFYAFSHNNYIELLTGIGLIGTTLHYIVPVGLAIASVILSKQSKETKLLGSLMFTLIAVSFISDIFAVNYYHKHFVIIYMFVYGSYIAYHKETKPEVRVAL